jgi:uncharacterized membrane protein YcaP (DUF421 family)
MNFNLIWQTILIFIVATIILRIGGRKTISQMTVPQTVIMIGIGTLLIQPVTGKGLWTTFGIASLLVLSLIITEYIQLKIDGVETFISGKAIPVIENGDIIEKNLRRLRLPVDKLEERLRQLGITKISDVQYATLESNGQLGYTLKNEKQPATKEDIQNLIELLKNGQLINPNSQTSNQNNIFSETLNNKNSTDIPKYLQ